MDSQLSCLSTMFFASLLLFLSSPSSIIASTRFVETVCNQTRNNSECLKALESDPRTASASDYKVLAPIALDLAIKYAKDSQTFMTTLIKTDPREAIKQCANAYKHAMLGFRSAKMELNEDPMTANYDITMGVFDNIQLCETWLKQDGVQVPAISSINNGLYLYSSIGGVITDNLY